MPSIAIYSEMKQIEQNDVLARVLQDAECDEILHTCLIAALKNDPVTFYKEFVLPRSGKLLSITQQINIASMTSAEELAKMASLTQPSACSINEQDDQTKELK